MTVEVLKIVEDWVLKVIERTLLMIDWTELAQDPTQQKLDDWMEVAEKIQLVPYLTL